MDTTIQLGVALMTGTAQEEFARILRYVGSVFEQHGIPLPRIITTDRDFAGVNALDEMFPNVPHLLCQ